jgi:hypothetical protein
LRIPLGIARSLTRQIDPECVQHALFGRIQWSGDAEARGKSMPPAAETKRKPRHIEPGNRTHSHLNAPIALLDEDDSDIGILRTEKEADQSGVTVAPIASASPHLQRQAGPDDTILGLHTRKALPPQTNSDQRTSIEAVLSNVGK